MRLSLIVPVYNEEKRAGKFIKDLLDYCQQKLSDYEILFVNDGSTDNTESLLKSLSEDDKNSRIISYEKNQGKGYAIKTGIDNSKGKVIIFIGAVGSIEPNQINLMLPLLEKNDIIIIGDRYSKKAHVQQPVLRQIAGSLFNEYVNVLFHLDIKDTLCGFKGFKKEIAKDLFNNLTSNRGIFDIEILFKARKKSYSIYKLPIKWTHKEDTKMSVIDPIKMAFRLLILRLKV